MENPERNLLSVRPLDAYLAKDGDVWAIERQTQLTRLGCGRHEEWKNKKKEKPATSSKWSGETPRMITMSCIISRPLTDIINYVNGLDQSLTDPEYRPNPLKASITRTQRTPFNYQTYQEICCFEQEVPLAKNLTTAYYASPRVSVLLAVNRDFATIQTLSRCFISSLVFFVFHRLLLKFFQPNDMQPVCYHLPDSFNTKFKWLQRCHTIDKKSVKYV